MDSLSSRAHKVTILVAEDDDGMRDLLIEELSNHRMDVIEVKNGHDALRQLRISVPDLVLSDLMMPSGGIPYLRQLRELAPKVPLIVLTSFGDPSLKNEVIQCGVDAYFDKPVRIQDIRAAIAKLLDHRSESDGEAPHPTSA